MSPRPEELLVLNCLLYADPSTMSGFDSVSDWAQYMLDHPAMIDDLYPKGEVAGEMPGEMTKDELRRVLDTASRSEYDQYKIANVSALPGDPAASSGDPEAHMATFIVDGQPVIVFQGTTGPYEWRDDGIGGYYDVTDTYRQQAALAYFEQQMAKYPNQQAIVSGHSKGGNDAQYITLLAGDRVGECYSFDGQGFNSAFYAKYGYQVAANGSKITSISNPSDFVNGFFFAVPGSRQVYTGDGGVHPGGVGYGAQHPFFRLHSPYTIFTDINGQRYLPTSSRPFGEQSGPMAAANDLLDFLQKYMDPKDFQFLCYSVMGTMMGEATYGEDFNDPGLLDRLLPLLKNYAASKGVSLTDVLVVLTLLGFDRGLMSGVALLWSTTVATPYCTIPRDFTQETLDVLLHMVEEARMHHADGPIADIFSDGLARLKHFMGLGDIADDSADRNSFYREVIDMNNMSATSIRKIWEAVATHEADYATKINGLTETLGNLPQYAGQLTSGINIG